MLIVSFSIRLKIGVFYFHSFRMKIENLCPDQRRCLLAGGRVFPLVSLYSTVSSKKAEQLLEETVCAHHTNFHSLILKAPVNIQSMFGGLYSPSCGHVSHNPVVFFAERACKEPARMLFARNLLIVKIGWYMFGLCWLAIPASHRR